MSNENDKVSAEFQSQIRNSLKKIPHIAKNINFNINEGIRLLLPELLDQKVKVSVEAVHQLLTTKDGIWAKFYDQVIQEIEDDLHLMSQLVKGYKNLPFKLTDDTWQKIRNEIKIYWQSRYCVPQEKYQLFARLFENLEYYKLSACFYTISSDEVTREIFSTFCSPTMLKCNVFNGFLVRRKVSKTEQFRTELEQYLDKISQSIYALKERRKLLISILTTVLILEIIVAGAYLFKSKESRENVFNVYSNIYKKINNGQ